VSAVAATGFVVQLSAGQGPVEARRFVQLLGGFIAEELARRGVGVESVAVTGDPPRSLALTCRGAAALAEDLVGTHVLVHAGRGRGQRKRWFVSVTRHDAGAALPSLRTGDLRLQAARAGGPGGQRVNKVASAVRALHLPTGIAVRAAGERSHEANRRAAVARVADKLAALTRARAAAVRDEKWREHTRVVRGQAAWRYRLVDGELQLA
jgi:protein subunit release factor B